MADSRIFYINKLEEQFENTDIRTISARVYRLRPDYLSEFSEEEFIKRFRISKASFRFVLGKIRNKLQSHTKKSTSISPETKLLIPLRFYASGNFLITVADFCGVSTSTVSRVVKQVSVALARLYKHFIKLPIDSATMEHTITDFYNIAKFLKVIGAIDCTHIRIQSPGGNSAEIFRNRKGYFSLNVQALCNANLMFQDLVVRWPGSAHDSNIFRNSRLKFTMEEGLLKSNFILGDSGYKQTNYMMTQLLTPVSPAERLYNESQIRTRNTIERSFGVWKRRFPVLSLGLRTSVDTIMAVIVACAVLHNICISSKDPLPSEDVLLIPEISEDIASNSDATSSNSLARTRLIENYFAKL